MGDSALLQLPVELLEDIISFLAQQDLYNLMRVCRFFRVIGEPRLYTHVSLTDRVQAKVFSTAIEGNHVREKYVLSAELNTLNDGCSDVSPWAACDLCPLISTLPNLQQLVIKAIPYWWDEGLYQYGKQHELDRLFARASLRIPPEQRILTKLKSCDIQFRAPGNRQWVFGSDDENDPVMFLSPTLRELTIREWFILKYDGIRLDAPKFKYSTPLETLCLLECIFDIDTIQSLLSIPRALKRLVLSNGIWPGHFHETRTMSRQLSKWAEALMQQKHSLERLELLNGIWNTYEGEECILDLRGMEKLQTVTYRQHGSFAYTTGNNGREVRVIRLPPIRVSTRRGVKIALC